MSTPVKLRSRVHLGVALALLGLAPLAGCEGPSQDDFISEGGISPDPTARLDGTVVYIGPRPQCVYVSGKASRIIGRVFLTMFDYGNPPAPEGTATSALNVLTISGDRLFELSDCAPENSSADFASRITRSVGFQWPRLPLVKGRVTELQIRGFYDYDEDLIPFFSVTRLPTRGDIVGAAIKDLTNASAGLAKITLPAFEDALHGAVVTGAAVALANPAWTERPAFKLNEFNKLPADAPFAVTLASAVGPASLRTYRKLTCPAGDGVSCGLSLQRLGTDDLPALDAAEIGLDIDTQTSNSSYAFYTTMVDQKTTAENAIDPAVPDMKPDPHPFLGAGLGVNWYGPMVVMQRRATTAAEEAREIAAGIPGVIMVGSVLLDDTGVPLKASYATTPVPIAVPPVAAVELIRGQAMCRVPYFPPGTALANDRLGDCQELPTGHYAVNVFNGIAGGAPAVASDTVRNESGITIPGGGNSGQSWSVPNELGDVDQVDPVLTHQGIDGTFIVHDPNPDGTAECTMTGRHGVCEGEPKISESKASDLGGAGIDAVDCVPQFCCEAIQHLYGLPRCANVTLADGSIISGSPTTLTPTTVNGRTVQRPNCIPFELPVQCAPAE